MYLGCSPDHSSTVTRVLNLNTKFISNQYHFVCDDHFSTVPNADAGGQLNPPPFNVQIWHHLLETGYENYVGTLDRDENNRPLVQPLDDEWLTPAERALRLQRRMTIRQRRLDELLRQQQRTRAPAPGGNQGGQGGPGNPIPILPMPIRPPIPPLNPVNGTIPANQEAEPVAQQENDELSVPEGADEAPTEEPMAPMEPPRQIGVPRGTNRRNNDEDEDEGDPTINRTLRGLQEQQPSRSGRRRFQPRRLGNVANRKPDYTTSKMRYSDVNEGFLASLRFSTFVESLKSDEFTKIWSLTTDYNYQESTCEWLHPLILAAKANSEDNPTWEEAMNGPLADQYWIAAEKEIKTLEKMEVWEVVPRLKTMNVLPSTWAFKCKRYPDGNVRKLKGRFCVRGDRQKDGIDFDSEEIFSPVVSWQTVCLLLILSLILGLETQQVDYTAAFTHAPIGDKDVFCEMPRGFTEPSKVLKLKKSLYG